MSLAQVYESFLRSPSAQALDEEAVLHYVPTLTTLRGAVAVEKHFTAQQRVLTKKNEKIIASVVAPDAIHIETETTLEFLSSGGAYLPGLDDNFVSDRLVTFPVAHTVHFNAANRISQIRMAWDQGSLLKQIDVIGARARNWPIRDGKDQARLIALNEVKAESTSSRPAPMPAQSIETPVAAGKARTKSSNVTGDPYASLSLFAPRDDENDMPKAIAPRGPASAKPPPRDYHELFVGNDSDASPQGARASKTANAVIKPKSQAARPRQHEYSDLFVGDETQSTPVGSGASPFKASLQETPIAPKFGAGKSYKPSRLFDVEDDDPSTPRSPDKSSSMKPHPKKYDHFEFGDGDDVPEKKTDHEKNKHSSQWEFEDFVTPQKVHPKNSARDQSSHQFSWEQDEETTESASQQAQRGKARPGNVAQFEFQDDGTPKGKARAAGSSLGGASARNNRLYENSVVPENNEGRDKGSAGAKEPLAPITNLKDRKKDFDPHFSIADASPASAGKGKPSVPEARKKVVNQMVSSWDILEDSPTATGKTSGKENLGIRTTGNGMGGQKGTQRSWGFGDEN